MKLTSARTIRSVTGTVPAAFLLDAAAHPALGQWLVSGMLQRLGGRHSAIRGGSRDPEPDLYPSQQWKSSYAYVAAHGMPPDSAGAIAPAAAADALANRGYDPTLDPKTNNH